MQDRAAMAQKSKPNKEEEARVSNKDGNVEGNMGGNLEGRVVVDKIEGEMYGIGWLLAEKKGKNMGKSQPPNNSNA